MATKSKPAQKPKFQALKRVLEYIRAQPEVRKEIEKKKNAAKSKTPA